MVDNPVLFEYSEKRLSAFDLYKRMCSVGEDAVDTDEFEKSIYFDDSSEMILDIIQARQIVQFDSSKIKNFPTKLDKIEYMFWKRYKDKNNNYGYFGIGFMASGKASDINYPNTFFFRLDNEYICYQKVVLPYSILKKDKNGVKFFEIYWDQFMMKILDEMDNERVCLKYKDGPKVYGICESTFKKRAREAGAIIKVGKSVLIDKDIFEEYLFSFRIPVID